MPYGLYLSAAGADVQRQRIEVMSNNLANADSPGFKRELAIAQSRAAEAIEQGSVSAGTGGIDDIGGGVQFNETVTDFTLGSIRPTNIPTDVALPGKGYFVVEKEGRQLLTRAGNFSINPRGELVTQQGYRVLSEGGQAITITDPNWQLRPDGVIESGGDQFSLRLLHAEPRALRHEGENLFSATETRVVKPEERRVAGGYLEGSNVQPITQMMELIEATRAYEANIKMIQNQDQVMGTLINRLLKSA